jgi:glycosyltransferase involved in cell wall biosynthesis
VKKVLIITYYWPPSGGAGVQRSVKFVKYLRAFQIEPIVLSVNPDQASYPVIDESLVQEIAKDQEVHRTRSFEALRVVEKLFGKKHIPTSGFSNKSKGGVLSWGLRFLRGNLFLPDARKGWVSHAFKEAKRLIEEKQIDTVFISSPPHSSQLIGLKLKKRFPHIKWVADMRDPWTDIYYYPELLVTPLMKRFDKHLERKVLNTADEIVVVSDAIKRLFASKIQHQNASKIHVIPNGYDEADFPNERSVNIKSEKRITYVGTMADSYVPDVFFKVLNELQNEEPALKFELQFVGSVSQHIREQLQAYGLPVQFIAHVPHAEAIRHMLDASILFLAIPAVPDAEGILTGKLFEYLACQRPIVALGPEHGDAAAILRSTEAGRMFDRENTIGLKAYIKELLSTESLVSSNNSVSQFERKALTEKLSKILR